MQIGGFYRLVVYDTQNGQREDCLFCLGKYDVWPHGRQSLRLPDYLRIFILWESIYDWACEDYVSGIVCFYVCSVSKHKCNDSIFLIFIVNIRLKIK